MRRTKRLNLSSVAAFFIILGLAGGPLSPSTAHAETSGSSSGISLEMQGRLDVFNTFGVPGPTFPIGGGGGGGLLGVNVAMVPMVTIGPRLLDGALFVGLGVGYTQSTTTQCEDISDGGCAEAEAASTTTSWSLSPVVTWDFLTTELANLYLAVWANLGEFGGTSTQTQGQGAPTVTVDVDGKFWWGFDIGVGIKANLTKALSIGTEWGWGIAGGGTGDIDSENSFLVHGIWGTLTLSVAIGL